MNKFPDAIYIQFDPGWTPDDDCSQLEGATHNEEQINPSDVKYIHAGATMDRVQAMAALVHYSLCNYNVPGVGTLNLVWYADDELHCDCNAPNCEHVLAVELHLEQRSTK